MAAKKQTTPANDESIRKTNKTQPSKVSTGNIMAFVNYVQVKSVIGLGTNLVVKNLDTGEEIRIEGTALVENALSADIFAETVITSQSNIIDLLMTSYNRPFTVVFEKESGEERTLRGRLIEPDHRRGRSKVEDLDKDAKDRFRLVDHRTIKSLVVDGTKYVTPNA